MTVVLDKDGRISSVMKAKCSESELREAIEKAAQSGV